MVSKNKDKIAVALIPVIHVGYLNFLKNYSEIYVLGKDLLQSWERYKNLERDLRQFEPEFIADLLQKTEMFEKVEILNKENLAEILDRDIVMPIEDVSEWVAEKYFADSNVEFENIFLRWNKPVSTQELEVDPDQIISTDKFHQEMMGKAKSLSSKSANWWRQIGVLAVKDGKVIAEAFNKHVPTQHNIDAYGDLRLCFEAGECHELSNSIHGEAALIAGCARKGINLSGTEIYVTTFPCPTCAKLIVEAGISKLYFESGYSLSDSKEILKNAEIEVIKVE